MIAVAGFAAGLLVGIVSGILTMFVLQFALFYKGVAPTIKRVSIALAQLVGFPGFWFAGPWLLIGVLKWVDFQEFVPPYAVGLLISYVTIVAYPLTSWVRWLGQALGKAS